MTTTSKDSKDVAADTANNSAPTAASTSTSTSTPLALAAAATATKALSSFTVPSTRGGRAEVICKKIADAIVLGQFKPGSRLDEVLLAGLFSVSRTPVREALKQLATQGLVVCRPNRSAIVAERLAWPLRNMLIFWRLTPRFAETWVTVRR